MAAIDSILNASVASVKRSGIVEASSLMATVSAVNSNGTVDVTRAADAYPSVRLLGTYRPAVGDTVQILKAAGGWVCLGPFQTTKLTNGWVAPSLASGYTNNGNGNGTVQYRIIDWAGSTHVEWCGGVSWTTSGSPPNSGKITTLGAAGRPGSLRSVVAAGGSDVVKVDFGTDGSVTIVPRTGSSLTTWLSLNGITYRID